MSSTLRTNRDFNRFWFGETLSLLGNQVTTLALPLAALQVFGASDQEVGLLRFLQLLPYVGLALVFGVLVDRARRRHVMLGANAVRLVLIAAIPALYWLDLLTLPGLLLMATAIGVASVLFDVSWMAYVPALVQDPKQYVEAGAKLSMTSSATDVAGPGLAGLLVGWLTAPVALIVDACSYAVSVVTLLLIRTPEPVPPRTGRHAGRELRDGLRWVFGRPVLRALALIGLCCNFSMVTVWTMFLLYGSQDLGLGARTLGFVFASASVGGLLGAGLARRVIARFPVGRVYFVAQSMLLLGPILVPVAAGPPAVLLATVVASFFLTYLGLGVAGVIIVSLRQTMTPQELMGRMTAVFRTLLFGGGALGGLAAGLLSAALGARGALTVAAIGSALVVPALALSPVVRLRTFPEPVETLSRR